MLGNIAAYEMTKNQAYLDYALKWARDNGWRFHEQRNQKGTAVNANSMICGDSYLSLLKICPQEGTDKYMIAETDELADNPENDDWWWIDSVYMAFPFLQKMSAVYQKDEYAEKAHRLFKYMRSVRGLYDEKEHLMKRILSNSNAATIPQI